MNQSAKTDKLTDFDLCERESCYVIVRMKNKEHPVSYRITWHGHRTWSLDMNYIAFNCFHMSLLIYTPGSSQCLCSVLSDLYCMG